MDDGVPSKTKKAKVVGATEPPSTEASVPRNGNIPPPQNGHAGAMPYNQPHMIQPYHAGMFNHYSWPMTMPPPTGMVPPTNGLPNGNAWQSGTGTVPPQNGNTGNSKVNAPPKRLKVKGAANTNETKQGMPPHAKAGGTIPFNGQGSTTASRHFSTAQAPLPFMQYPMAVSQPFAGQQIGAPIPSPPLPDMPVPLLDRQIFSMMNAQWSMPWSQQVSKNVMTFLRFVPAFVIAKPGEIESQCPLSRHLRKAWKVLVHGDSELPGSDKYAAGICCPACLKNGSCGTKNFIFIDFRDEDELFDALKELYKHVKFCQPARNMAPELKKRSFTIEYQSDTLSLKAFSSWFCGFIHESEAIDRGFHVLKASQQQVKLSENAVVRYMNLKGASDRAFEDLNCALSIIPSRTGKNIGSLLASDLTEVPSKDSLIEFPFYLLILEHIEIVRVTNENPGNHKELLKQKATDALVVFQCNCCHGQTCAGTEEGSIGSDRGRPYVVYQSSFNKRTHLVCELVELIFQHLQACLEVPSSNKRRLRRAMPSAKSPSFDDFTTYFLGRVSEWDQYLKTKLDFIKSAESVVPYEDVAIWRPVNDLIEGSESMLSTFTSLGRKQVAPRLASDADDNDVIEGFEGASEYIGNRRFRKLVAKYRGDFLSTTSLSEKEAINKKVYEGITRRGGTFRRFDIDGIWRHLTKAEMAYRCRSALQNGFGGLFIPRPPCQRRGRGSNVIETEVPPQFDLLSDRKRDSIVTKMWIDDDEEGGVEDERFARKRLSPGSKCRAVADI